MMQVITTLDKIRHIWMPTMATEKQVYDEKEKHSFLQALYIGILALYHDTQIVITGCSYDPEQTLGYYCVLDIVDYQTGKTMPEKLYVKDTGEIFMLASFECHCVQCIESPFIIPIKFNLSKSPLFQLDIN